MGRYTSNSTKVSDENVMIKVNDVEYIRKDLSSLQYISRKDGQWEIGKYYAIRTVTMIDHGLLVDLTPTDFILVEAAWIADTGRWSDFIHGKITPNEVEPFPKDQIVFVNRGAYIDACQLDKKFLEQK